MLRIDAPRPDTDADVRLSVRGLRKAYGDRIVLADLSFTVLAGEAVALVGPNGTGKTTALRCILGTDPPDAGSTLLDGAPLDERLPTVRARVAAVLDDMGWFPELTSAEHLDLLARAHGDPAPDDRVDEALDVVGLDAVAHQSPLSLSSGQRRRLALATTLIRPYDVLILDEPEQRLDTAGRAWLAGHLTAQCERGVAVLLASHDPELLRRINARSVALEPPEGATGPVPGAAPDAPSGTSPVL